jgi:hypothetical protein
VAKRASGLIIAIQLTVLGVALTACYVWHIWSGWTEDVWSLRFSVLPVVLGSASLVNIWSKVPLGQDVVVRSASQGQTGELVAAQKRGLADV